MYTEERPEYPALNSRTPRERDGDIISPQAAGRIAKPFGGVPRVGYEKLVVIDGRAYWLGRTDHWGKRAWWLYAATGSSS